MHRRHFLLVCTSAATGLWFRDSAATQSFTSLSRNVVIALSGNCSFCSKAVLEVRAMARALGASVRICGECIDLCLDIVGPSNCAPSVKSEVARDVDQDTVAMLTDLAKIREVTNDGAFKSEVDKMIFDLRARLSRNSNHTGKTYPPPKQREGHSEVSGVFSYACSFCYSRPSENEVVAGPQHYICKQCVCEAALLMGHTLSERNRVR